MLEWEGDPGREAAAARAAALALDPNVTAKFESARDLDEWSRRALALVVTIQVSRYCNSSFPVLVVQIWLYHCT